MFWFKSAEPCPTIEEFLAILGYDPGQQFVAVSCNARHKEIFSNVLGLPTSITNSMIEGHMVNFRAILSRLINKCTHRVTDNMQKNFGLALCFGGNFLLCSGRLGFVDGRSIGIVSQIKDGDNPASLILAKTLLGSDSIFHGGVSTNFLGSPLTL